MSLFDELIKSSDDVKIKKLYEVTIWSKVFQDFPKEKQLKNSIKYKYLSEKEIQELVSKDGNIKLLTTYPSNLFADSLNIDKEIYKGEIVYIPSGGNSYIHYHNGAFLPGGVIIATSYDKNVLSNKYLYYFLNSKHEIISSCFRGSGIKHPYMPDILKLEIPIPSLELQNKIVNILDAFNIFSAEL
ncbi:restriction endonuclease subunit S, partial [Mycoplasmopsis gallinarum]|uniref:restriction endonuclease subunit S n=1 Tax=Mycoplasmopsis gallinarum TaxID=29557 RepID=UPI000B317F26